MYFCAIIPIWNVCGIYIPTCLFNRPNFFHVILFWGCCCCSTTFPFAVEQFNMCKKKHNAPLGCCKQMRKFNSEKKSNNKNNNKKIHWNAYTWLWKSLWWCCLASNMTNVFFFCIVYTHWFASRMMAFLAMLSCNRRIHLLVTCKFVSSKCLRRDGMARAKHNGYEKSNLLVESSWKMSAICVYSSRE